MEHLQVRTFGQAEVLVNGRPAEWHAQAARDLFFYLLSHPEGRTKDEILETLWGLDPDAAASNRFRVTVHRLRSALEMPDAVVEDHGRYHLAPAVFAASDVHALHAALDEASHNQDVNARLAAYQRALAAYGGDYLPGERNEWAEGAREEHKAAYVRAALELSLLYCDGADCNSAVTSLVRAMRADPFIGENYHQKLMTCLSVVEGKYSAIEHYRRFLNFLRDELEDTPMPETRELAERIKLGEQICRRKEGPDAPVTQNCPLTPSGRCPGVLGDLLNMN
ncbi:MAG TPA: BTAD domain-containing putative transcriptional regulator [Deinococcales bacterium]|nr:BTAD domain-containing putative transcriptional regulator [Deinococcales bacterium]